MRIKNSSIYAGIQLIEGRSVPPHVQVLRVGKFKHPTYGDFEITRQILMEMKVNFENKVRGIDTAFDYYHDSNEDASAWVRSLELREEGSELWALVDWTPKAAQKLAERELRYFSPDFAFKWTDPETGVTFNNVLFGGGLTNRPFVKEMAAIVATETIGETNMKTVQELELEVKKLSEEKIALEKKLAEIPAPAAAAPAESPADESAEISALKSAIANLQAALTKAQSDNSVMMGDMQKMKDAKALAEKETAFNVLLTEGKACVAQKESYLKGDMNEFIKLAQPLNMKGAGSSENPTGDSDVSAIIKLAEEKKKVNPKLSHGEAVSMAKKELKK